VAGTGLSFATFGAAGFFLGVLVLPLMRLLPGSPRERDLRCQYVVHRAFRIFVRMLEALGLLSVRSRGAEALREPGQLVVANHPTLLDVVFLVSLMPQADCVVKREVLANPFMRGVAACTGYLSNALGDELLDACAERLRSGRSLVLFPEGTRSPAGGLGEFQRGAAHVALRSGRPLLPVVIRCDPPGLLRGQKWYAVPDRPMEITLDCAQPLHLPDAAQVRRGRGAAARRLSAELRDFYVKRLQNLSFRGN
jgi:1-acyl-sn-glycerol-3-phosphate acyltransferase